MLTGKQTEILKFIKSYINKNNRSPVIREIANHFGFSSTSTVHGFLKKLEKEGVIFQEKNKPRSIRIIKSEPMVQIPLKGEIAAGEPIEAMEDKEVIAVPKNKLPSISKEIFALRVVGNSMIDENINDGDIILVRKEETAENGQKVVALLENEAALKKFYRDKNKIRLEPANKDFKPIILERGDDIKIQGIFIDVIKRETPDVNIKTGREEIKKYKEIPKNKIIEGDALKKIRKLPDDSCDIIIADPPYNIGKNFGNNGTKKEITDYVRWSRKWIKEAFRVLKPTGTMFIYGFSEILAHISVEIPNPKRWLIWHYTNKNVPSLKFWQRSHETIIVTWKEKPIFNRDEVRESYTEGFLNGAAGKVRKETNGRFSRGEKETIYKAHKNGALPRDVLKVPALAGGAGMKERWFLCRTCNEVYSPDKLKNHRNHDIEKHPTQKPLDLTRRLIRSSAPKRGGLILVPFVGSGSECAVAKELGYDFLGFELNPEYIRIAEKFIRNTRQESRLL